MSNVIPFEQKQLPAAMQKLFSAEKDKDDLSGGVVASFAVLSLRGSIWRLKYKGEEHVLQDPNSGDPKRSLELVIIRSNPQLSKIYYKKNYDEGDEAAPDCWSLDGLKPDMGAAQKQAETCANCPHNVWGSKITPQGTKTKACADARRVAVVGGSNLEQMKAEQVDGPMLLRIPPASLQALAAYGDALRSQQWPYYAVVTKVSFDTDASYPKLTFTPVRPLTDEEADVIIGHRNGEKVKRILSTMEGDVAETETVYAQSEQPAPAAASAPAPAPTPAPEPAPAPAPEPAPEPAPAPAPAAAQAPASEAPAPAVQETAAEAPKETSEDIDKIITNLLG